MNSSESQNSRDSQLITISAGALLIRENESSRKMYILKSGKVRVFKEYMNRRITLAILGAGEVFGELSFFDAEKRSASVEALTDVTAIVIDGERANQQIGTLPDWVLPIFRTVFHRFREADSKITVLQSMNEYQKKIFKTDTVGRTVYLELLRFIKALEMLYERESKEGSIVKSDTILRQLDELLGKRFIGLKVFWRLLKEYDFIDHLAEESTGTVLLRQNSLKEWKNYLAAEAQSERYLLLSYPSIALLRRIVSFIKTVRANTNCAMNVRFEDIKIETLALYPEAIKELTEKNLLTVNQAGLVVDPAAVCDLFQFQSLIKSFDHTIVALD